MLYVTPPAASSPGTPTRFVQEFLRHSRITTTERYMHAKARPGDLERVNLAFAARPSNDRE